MPLDYSYFSHSKIEKFTYPGASSFFYQTRKRKRANILDLSSIRFDGKRALLNANICHCHSRNANICLGSRNS